MLTLDMKKILQCFVLLLLSTKNHSFSLILLCLRTRIICRSGGGRRRRESQDLRGTGGGSVVANRMQKSDLIFPILTVDRRPAQQQLF